MVIVKSKSPDLFKVGEAVLKLVGLGRKDTSLLRGPDINITFSSNNLFKYLIYVISGGEYYYFEKQCSK